MNERSRLWLLSIACLSLAPGAAMAKRGLYVDPPPAKQSHHDLPGGPDVSAEMMAERLRELQELHQLQDQVQGLLQDPDFLNKLQTNFSEKQLQQLRDKILRGNGLGGDRDWKQLLESANALHKLDSRQIDLLRRLAERPDNKPKMEPNVPPLMSGPQQSPPSSSPSPGNPHPSTLGPFPPSQPAKLPLWDRLRKETTDWIAEHMDGFGGDVAEALTELASRDEGAPLAELLRTVNRGELPEGGWVEKAADLSNHLPDLDDLLRQPDGTFGGLHSLFRDAPVPSLPRMPGAPSLPALPEAPSAGAGDWSGAAVLLVLGVVAMLLWKAAGWSASKAGRDEEGKWRLGPWPVSPGAVSTGRELIRAFEHLALLRLGPEASTCHHRELAGRLAGQDDGDPARRRHAAEQLAALYEQARYAPPAEPLSPEELADARHALCYLAGVTAV